MKWDYAWHGQERREVDVHEAISLRDSGTLKTGDLFCCVCENTRLSPVNAITRARHLRKHPKYRAQSTRKSCNKISKAREKGESWKHSRVVDSIVKYLETDARDRLKIDSVRPGNSVDEADIIVNHSEILDGLNSKKTYIVIPFQNLRRSREIYQKHSPDSIAVEIHRWRDGDVDFIEYIRERVDLAFEKQSTGSMAPEFLHSATSIPNLGVWSGKTGGLGRAPTLKIDSNMDPDSEEFEVLSEIESLIDSVEEHNMWAISVPGKQRFHLRNLKFERYDERCGHHDDPSIDAVLSQWDIMAPQQSKKQDWQRARDGDEAAFEEIVTMMDQRRAAGLESLIEEKVAEGGDPVEVRKLFEKFAESLSPSETELREQLEYEREVLEGVQNTGQEYGEALLDRMEKTLLNLFKNDGLTVEGNEMTIKCDQGEVNLSEIGNNHHSSGIGKTIHHSLIAEIPEIHFWDEIEAEGRKEILGKVRRFYRRISFFRGRPIVWPLLTGFDVGESPVTLKDTTGIEAECRSFELEDESEFRPMTKFDLSRLMYFIWADRDFNYPNSKHHSFVELIRKVSHSTDGLTRNVNLNLPQPIEDMLTGVGEIQDQVMDLISKALLNKGPDDGEE